MGNYGYGKRNEWGGRLIQIMFFQKLNIANRFFMKQMIDIETIKWGNQ